MSLNSVKQSFLYRSFAITIAVFLLHGDLVRCAGPSFIYPRQPDAYQLAVSSFSNQLRIAAQGSDEQWIQAIRAAALDFAQTCEIAGMVGKEIEHHVAIFLKSIETQHGRPIPIQIATQAAHFVLYDEMEAFLRREIEFAAAKGEEEKEKIYRLALYELLTTKFFSSFVTPRRSPQDDNDIVLFFTKIIPEINYELFSGKKNLEELLLLWNEAFSSYLNTQKLGDREESLCLRLFHDLAIVNLKIFFEGFIYFPNLPANDIPSQTIQMGLRFIVNGIHNNKGSLEKLIGRFIANLFFALPPGCLSYAGLDHFFDQMKAFCSRSSILNKKSSDPSKGKPYYQIIDRNSGQSYFLSPAPDGKTLSEAEMHVVLASDIEPERDDALPVRGVLTRDGKIKLNPNLHGNTLDLLATWAHELFHLKWIYTLKSRPIKVEEWTRRMMKDRQAWEVVEKFYLEAYADNADAKQAWFASSTQRKVNEILALASGILILIEWRTGRLSKEYLDEFEMLQSRFRLDKEIKLTPAMEEEIKKFLPILVALERHSEAREVLADVMDEPLSDIKKMDASFTEADIAMPCDRMAYGEYVARERAKEKEDLDDKDLEDIEKAVKEMGKDIDEYVDDLVEEASEDSEIETDADNDQARHNIKEITIKAVTRYIKSGKKDRNFEEMLAAAASALQQKVFTRETPEQVKQLLEKPHVKDHLKKIYDKAESEYREKATGSGETNGVSEQAKEHLAAILAKLQGKFGHQHGHEHGHHHHGEGGGHGHGPGIGPHHPLMLFLFIGLGILYLLDATGIYPTGIAHYFPYLLGMVAPLGGLPNPFAPPEPTPEEIVAKYTTNLTQMAKDGKFDDTGYLENEAAAIDRNAGVSGEKHHSILVGDPVVGESLVEAMVCRQTQGLFQPKYLQDATYLEFNTARFIDELAIPGKFEEEIRKLVQAIQESKKTQKVVLLLNFQDIYRVGALKGKMMANLYFLFKEAIQDPDIAIVGVANKKVYEEYFDARKNEDLNRAFHKIDLDTPPQYDLLRVLREYKERIPKIYGNLLPEGVQFELKTKTLKEAIELCRKYDPSGTLPNKVQEILDRIIVGKLGKKRELELKRKDTAAQLKQAVRQLVEAEEKGDEKTAQLLNEMAGSLLQQQAALEKEAAEHEAFLKKVIDEKKWEITLDDIALQISIETQVPLFEIQQDEKEKLARFPEEMRKRVIGQDPVIDQIYSALAIKSDGLSEKGKPIGLFFLLGPTGVGKTEIARSMARQLFASEDATIRLDMSEYMLPNAKDKMIGAPPGYVGYEQGGYLTNRVRERPYSVVLFDEIEKAHPSTYDLFLQVIDDGRLTDNRGQTVDFSNTLILMTSNLGMGPQIDSKAEEMKDEVLEQLEKTGKEKLAELDALRQSKNSRKLTAFLNGNLKQIEERLEQLIEFYRQKGLEPVDLVEMHREVNDYRTNQTYTAKVKEDFLRPIFRLWIDLSLQAKKETVRVYDLYRKLAALNDKKDSENPEEFKKFLNEELVFRRELLRLESMQEENEAAKMRLIDQILAIHKLIQSDDAAQKEEFLRRELKEAIREKIMKAIQNHFRTEFIGRINKDHIIIFDPLSRKSLNKILDIKLAIVNEMLAREGYSGLELSPELRDKVIDEGYDIVNGARPLLRALKRIVLTPLADAILRKQFAPGAQILAKHDAASNVVFEAKAAEKKTASGGRSPKGDEAISIKIQKLKEEAEHVSFESTQRDKILNVRLFPNPTNPKVAFMIAKQLFNGQEYSLLYRIDLKNKTCEAVEPAYQDTRNVYKVTPLPEGKYLFSRSCYSYAVFDSNGNKVGGNMLFGDGNQELRISRQSDGNYAIEYPKEGKTFRQTLNPDGSAKDDENEIEAFALPLAETNPPSPTQFEIQVTYSGSTFKIEAGVPGSTARNDSGKKVQAKTQEIASSAPAEPPRNDIFRINIKFEEGEEESSKAKALEKVKAKLPPIEIEIAELERKQNVGTLIEKATNAVELKEKKEKRDRLKERIKALEEQTEEEYRKINEAKEEAKRKRVEQVNGYFENLTIRALEGKLEENYPAPESLSQLLQILERKKRNYPFVCASSKQDARDLTDTFALRSAQGEIAGFEKTRVLRLQLEAMKEHFSLVGAFEKEIRDVVEMIDADDKEKNLRTVIVIDFDEAAREIQNIRVNPFILGFFLRLFKGRDTVSFAMTTTQEKTREDEAFPQYFSWLKLPDFTEEAALQRLLLFDRARLERESAAKHAGEEPVALEPQALERGARLSAKHQPGQSILANVREWVNALFPEKYGYSAALQRKIADIRRNLKDIFKDMVQDEEVPAAPADFLKDHPDAVKLIRELRASKEKKKQKVKRAIGEEDVIAHAEKKLKIPAQELTADEAEKILGLEPKLKSRIIGQNEAVEAVVNAVKIARAGLKFPKQPMFTGLFAGPSGVGKTELAKQIAKELYGWPPENKEPNGFIRYDMSEYQEEHQVSKMIGAPPGYIGFDDKIELLTEKVIKNPNCVIVFDEIEKAHPRVVDILLQILEDGRLTDSKGQTADFSKAVILITSNVGMEKKVWDPQKKQLVTVSTLYPELSEAVKEDDPQKLEAFHKKLQKEVETGMRDLFRPEFLNRLEAKIVFKPLGLSSLYRVLDVFIDELKANFSANPKNQGIKLEIGNGDEEVKKNIYQLLIDKYYDPQYGARRLKNAVESMVTGPLVQFLAVQNGRLQPGDTIRAKRQGDRIVFEVEKGAAEEAKEGDLTAEEKAILQNLIEKLQGVKPYEEISDEDVEDWLDPFGAVAVDGKQKKPEGFDAWPATRSQQNDFGRKDAIFARGKLESIMEIATGPSGPRNDTSSSVIASEPEGRSEAISIKEALTNWIIEMVKLAKMANLREGYWQSRQTNILDFDKLYFGEFKEALGSAIDEINASKWVSLHYKITDDGIWLAVQYNSILTRQIQRLLEKEYATEEELMEALKDKKAFQGIAKALHTLKKSFGAETGYFTEEADGESCTTFWLRVPRVIPASIFAEMIPAVDEEPDIARESASGGRSGEAAPKQSPQKENRTQFTVDLGEEILGIEESKIQKHPYNPKLVFIPLDKIVEGSLSTQWIVINLEQGKVNLIGKVIIGLGTDINKIIPLIDGGFTTTFIDFSLNKHFICSYNRDVVPQGDKILCHSEPSVYPLAKGGFVAKYLLHLDTCVQAVTPDGRQSEPLQVSNINITIGGTTKRPIIRILRKADGGYRVQIRKPTLNNQYVDSQYVYDANGNKVGEEQPFDSNLGSDEDPATIYPPALPQPDVKFTYSGSRLTVTAQFPAPQAAAPRESEAEDANRREEERMEIVKKLVEKISFFSGGEVGITLSYRVSMRLDSKAENISINQVNELQSRDIHYELVVPQRAKPKEILSWILNNKQINELLNMPVFLNRSEVYQLFNVFLQAWQDRTPGLLSPLRQSKLDAQNPIDMELSEKTKDGLGFLGGPELEDLEAFLNQNNIKGQSIEMNVNDLHNLQPGDLLFRKILQTISPEICLVLKVTNTELFLCRMTLGRDRNTMFEEERIDKTSTRYLNLCNIYTVYPFIPFPDKPVLSKKDSLKLAIRFLRSIVEENKGGSNVYDKFFTVGVALDKALKFEKKLPLHPYREGGEKCRLYEISYDPGMSGVELLEFVLRQDIWEGSAAGEKYPFSNAIKAQIEAKLRELRELESRITGQPAQPQSEPQAQPEPVAWPFVTGEVVELLWRDGVWHLGKIAGVIPATAANRLSGGKFEEDVLLFETDAKEFHDKARFGTKRLMVCREHIEKYGLLRKPGARQAEPAEPPAQPISDKKTPLPIPNVTFSGKNLQIEVKYPAESKVQPKPAPIEKMPAKGIETRLGEAAAGIRAGDAVEAVWKDGVWHAGKILTILPPEMTSELSGGKFEEPTLLFESNNTEFHDKAQFGKKRLIIRDKHIVEYSLVRKIIPPDGSETPTPAPVSASAPISASVFAEMIPVVDEPPSASPEANRIQFTVDLKKEILWIESEILKHPYNPKLVFIRIRNNLDGKGVVAIRHLIDLEQETIRGTLPGKIIPLVDGGFAISYFGKVRGKFVIASFSRDGMPQGEEILCHSEPAVYPLTQGGFVAKYWLDPFQYVQVVGPEGQQKGELLKIPNETTSINVIPQKEGGYIVQCRGARPVGWMGRNLNWQQAYDANGNKVGEEEPFDPNLAVVESLENIYPPPLPQPDVKFTFSGSRLTVEANGPPQQPKQRDSGDSATAGEREKANKPSGYSRASLDQLVNLITIANPRLIITERNSTGMITLLMEASSDASLLNTLLKIGIEQIPQRVELALALTETAKRLGFLQSPDARFRMVRAFLNLLNEPESRLQKLKTTTPPPNLLDLFDRLPFEQAV